VANVYIVDCESLIDSQWDWNEVVDQCKLVLPIGYKYLSIRYLGIEQIGVNVSHTLTQYHKELLEQQYAELHLSP